MAKKTQAFGKYVQINHHRMVRTQSSLSGFEWKCSKCDWSIFLEAKTIQEARQELSRGIILHPEKSCDERVVELVMTS